MSLADIFLIISQWKHISMFLKPVFFFYIIICVLTSFVFFRFGLSNRFDTEFPSVLTGKVHLLFSVVFLLSLASCCLFSSK